eukprot:UN26667
MKDLVKIFETDDLQEICITILKEGTIQVSSKERNAENERKFKEIASLITTKCIN